MFHNNMFLAKPASSVAVADMDLVANELAWEVKVALAESHYDSVPLALLGAPLNVANCYGG